MMRMSKAVAVALAFVALSLTACQGGDYDEDQSEDTITEVVAGDNETLAAGESPDTGDTDSASIIAPGDLVLRDFRLPLPLFAPDSAWNQMALDAAVLPESDQQILLLYR